MRRSNVIYHIINAAIFIILEVAALSMIKHNGILQNTWFSKGAHVFMGNVWGGTQVIKDYFSLRKVNDALALENHSLKMQLMNINEMIDLSKIEAGDNIVGDFRYIPATIVKNSTNKQHNYIILDKGSNDGIVNGAGVITNQGAIGVIDAVGKNYSYAISFLNFDMNISARLGKTGSVGPLIWDGISSNTAILKEIPHHVEFHPGDTVYTSGYSSIFPADIPLGLTQEAKIVNGSTFEIKVKMLEDFKATRYVTVVENLYKDEIIKLGNDEDER